MVDEDRTYILKRYKYESRYRYENLIIGVESYYWSNL